MKANASGSRRFERVAVVLAVLDGSIGGDATVQRAIALARETGRHLVFAYIDDELSPHAVRARDLAAAHAAAAIAGVRSRAIALPAFSPAAIVAASQITGATVVFVHRGDANVHHAPYPGALVDILVRTARVPVSVVA